MAELTPEARKLIEDSIAIVREDRFEAFVRGTYAGRDGDGGSDGGQPEPGKPKVDPPPRKDTPAPDPEPARSAYWGIFE